MLSKPNSKALVVGLFAIQTEIWSLGAECHPKEEFKPEYKVYMCIKSRVHIYYGSKLFITETRTNTKHLSVSKEEKKLMLSG